MSDQQSSGRDHCGIDHEGVYQHHDTHLCPVCGELTVPDIEDKLTVRIVPGLLPPLPGDGGDS